MNKKLPVFLILLISICSLVLLASCSNFVSPASGVKDGSYVIINLGGEGKTLWPGEQKFYLENVAKILLSFQGLQGQPAVSDVQVNAFPMKVGLDPGDWIITASAYVSINGEDKLAAEGQAVLPTLGINDTKSVSIKLGMPLGAETGNGTFSYSLSLPAVPFDSAQMTLHPVAGGADKVYNLLEKNTSSELLEAGYYILSVSLQSNNYKVGRVEAVHIYPNMTTEANYSFSAADFLKPALLIWQVYGTGQTGEDTNGSVSHSFIELYNTGKEDISLNGYSIQYSEGGTSWDKLDLTGTIKAGSSYLILGAEKNLDPRLDLNLSLPDQYWSGKEFSNRNFKIALMHSTTLLDIKNPFDIGSGYSEAAFVDMMGAINSTLHDTGHYDTIDAWEGMGSGPIVTDDPRLETITFISKQKTARRKSVIDTNNNAADFESIDFRSSGLSDKQLQFYRPKSGAYGPWNPEAIPEILILQAYGTGINTDDGTSGAVSHSFIELYNPGVKNIDLTGYTIHYSEGGILWNKLLLDGTIKAGSSYLVLGAQMNSGSRINLGGSAPDMVWPGKVFSNRNFKIALVRGTGDLHVINPFDASDGLVNGGLRIPGYVDMLGVTNSGSDSIDAGETNTGNYISKQKSTRRANLIDTDNNKKDFTSIDYRLPIDGGINNKQADFYRPKNSAFGPWDPVYVPPPLIIETRPESTAEIIILQAYGTGNYDDGAVSHSFVELYNKSDRDINLDGYSIQYSEGGNSWDMLPLYSEKNLSSVIKAGYSYLILGKKMNESGAGTIGRLQLNEGDADQIWTDKVFDNRAFKIALMRNTDTLHALNPFDLDGDWTSVAGYEDMLGAVNDGGDTIDAAETAPSQAISKQKAARRNSVVDSNNNSRDFDSIDYRIADNDKYQPWGTSKGSRTSDSNFMPDPKVDSGKDILILQAYGTGGKSDAAVSNSFVELYNKTNASISLSGYYLWYSGSEGTADWTSFPLSGTIPAHGSFLILGKRDNSNARLVLNSADYYSSTVSINSNAFKIALLKTSTMPSANPFISPGPASSDYIDMLGTYNTDYSIDAFEGETDRFISKQKAARRKSLIDSNNNKNDFMSIDYRLPPDGISSVQLELYRPRTSTETLSGWDPFK